MLTRDSTGKQVATPAERRLRRRVVFSGALGATGLGVAAVLIYPKVIALTAGAAALGVGAVANLALVFGSVMFLREAKRAQTLLRAANDEPAR